MSEPKTLVYICPLGHLTPAAALESHLGEGHGRCPECRAPVARYFISDPFATVDPTKIAVGPTNEGPTTTSKMADVEVLTANSGADQSPPLQPSASPSVHDAAASPLAPWAEFANPASTPSPRSSRPFISGAPIVAGYTLLGELGRGATGVVYKARHDRLKRLVALKMILSDPSLDLNYLKWFQSEAEAVARLDHPNIVQIFEVGEQNGQPYLALEFVSGGTLKKRLNGKPQPLWPSARFIEIVARAVHTAHQRGIIHRDLKPANLLLERNASDEGWDGSNEEQLEADQVFGMPKITDFGLSKRIDDDFDPVRYGDVVGTPLYMAPEQAKGETEDIGPGADIYALGAILYEMITGRPPFFANSVAEVLSKVTRETPVPPRRLRRKVPRDLEAICMRCLEKDPHNRYHNAQTLADDLQRFREGLPIRARHSGPLARAWNWSLHNRVPASLLVAVTLVLGAGQWKLRQLSDQIVAKSALASAAQQTATIGEVYALYADVAKQIREAKGEATKLELTHRYPAEHAVPIPARFTIMLGEKMEELTENNPEGRQGQMFSKLHVQSNYPFRDRPGNPPKRGSFGADALKNYADNPDKKEVPFSRIETDSDDRTVLRYATALTLKESCLGCHNTRDNYEKKYRETARTDWKEGDVRGVLVIDIPLTKEFKQTNENVFGAYLLLGGLAATGLAVSWLTLTFAGR